jgi:hypothetical protein
LITVLLQFGGSAARVATTLAETGDVNELMNHGLAAGLNVLLVRHHQSHGQESRREEEEVSIAVSTHGSTWNHKIL